MSAARLQQLLTVILSHGIEFLLLLTLLTVHWCKTKGGFLISYNFCPIQIIRIKEIQSYPEGEEKNKNDNDFFCKMISSADVKKVKP